MKLFTQSGRTTNRWNKCFQAQLAKLNMTIFCTLAVSSQDICSEKKKQTEIPQSLSPTWHEIRDENVFREALYLMAKDQKQSH